MKKLLVLSCLALVGLFAPSGAFATTIVDVGLGGNAGFWFTQHNKGYTYNKKKEAAVAFTQVTTLDQTLFGSSTPDSVYMTWMTRPGSLTERDVTTASILFYRGNQVVLGLSAVADSAHITMNPAAGAAGDFQLNGLFTATSGLLAGRVLDELTVALRYNFGLIFYEGVDFHFNQGDLRISSNPPSEGVPEPTSVALLLTGLAGLKRAKRTKTLPTAVPTPLRP